jgi:hypothetical protein
MSVLPYHITEKAKTPLSLISLKSILYTMSERLVEIPITKQTRDEIKKIKGTLTYEQFLREVLKTGAGNRAW